ncbi:MAG: hypothetical protein AVDCRST_MAG53-876, partial [uncultured Solirubrobacteraceae bacterium]
ERHGATARRLPADQDQRASARPQRAPEPPPGARASLHRPRGRHQGRAARRLGLGAAARPPL